MPIPVYIPNGRSLQDLTPRDYTNLTKPLESGANAGFQIAKIAAAERAVKRNIDRKKRADKALAEAKSKQTKKSDSITSSTSVTNPRSTSVSNPRSSRHHNSISVTSVTSPRSSSGYYNSSYRGLVPDEFKSREDVRRIQQEMVDAGLSLGSHGVDGIWGKDTLRAYELYQAQRAMKEAHSVTPEALLTVAEIGYNPQFDYSQGARSLGSLGIRDYASLVNFVKANPDHPLAKDLMYRFHNDLSDQRLVERTLGVSGRYGRGIFGGGDLSDIMRNMATWAGTQRAEYDKNNRYHWEEQNGKFVQVPGSSENGYGVGKISETTYYNGTPVTTTTTTSEETSTAPVTTSVSNFPSFLDSWNQKLSDNFKKKYSFLRTSNA